MKVKRQTGFTLIELMIVVVIIGILATMAIPRFMTASTRSKQSEAKMILKQVYVNQRSYYQENGNYWDPGGVALTNGTPQAFAAIWIELMPPARYTYTIEIIDGGLGFEALATVDSPGLDADDAPDQWRIDNLGSMSVVSDDAYEE